MKNFKELHAWQESMVLAKAIYMATKNKPKEEIYGLRAQMRSAAVSIPSNIAEGYCRNNRGEYLHFLGISRGSVGELETQLILASDLEMVVYTEELQAQIDSVGRLLTALLRSLQKGS